MEIFKYLNTELKKKSPSGITDYVALALTTFGVGYIPGAPGTYGSIVGVGIYLFAGLHISEAIEHGLKLTQPITITFAFAPVALTAFSLVGIWASGRSIAMFGTDDPHEAVVDEVIGQLITFLFIPFTTSWPVLLAGFILFRIFDIWKPYPIDDLQNLPGGLGVCADDIVAGVYAGVCLSVIYAIMLLV